MTGTTARGRKSARWTWPQENILKFWKYGDWMTLTLTSSDMLHDSARFLYIYRIHSCQLLAYSFQKPSQTWPTNLAAPLPMDLPAHCRFYQWPHQRPSDRAWWTRSGSGCSWVLGLEDGLFNDSPELDDSAFPAIFDEDRPSTKPFSTANFTIYVPIFLTLKLKVFYQVLRF